MMFEILQVQIVLAVCWLIYQMVLKHAAMFRINRYYLMLVPVMGSIMPFINWPQSDYTTYSVALPEVVLTMADQTAETQVLPYVVTALCVVYGLGVMGVLTYTLYQYVQLRKVLKKALSTNVKAVYELPDTQVSFTHLNKVYLGAALKEADKELVLSHELQHRDQRHWIDQFLMLCLCTVWWFNPFIWLLRKAIRENHEYLADKGVQAGIRSGQYYAILFEQAVGARVYPLSQHFGDHSLTLKRIKMMERKISRWTQWGSLALVLPLLTALFWMSSCENTSESIADTTAISNQKLTEDPDTYPEYEGGQSAMVEKLVAELKYPETAKADSLEGTVFVQFVVNTTGQVEQVKVAKGVRDDLDTEALRVVTQLNDWKPGTKDHEPVNVQYTLPIKFKL